MRNKFLLLLILTAALTACAPAGNAPQSESIVARGSASPSPLIKVSAPNVDAAEPSITAGLNGTIFITWVEHRDNEADLMIRQYDSNGQPKGEAVRINPTSGQVKTWYGDPPTVKVTLDGAVYVGWTAKAEGAKGSANVLYLSVSRNGGQSFAAPVKVNDDTAPAAHGMHSLAIDKDGRIYVAWLDERYLNSHKELTDVKVQSETTFHYEKAAFLHHTPEPEKEAQPNKETEPNAELYFAASTNGGKTFSPNKKLAGNVCPCCKTSLLAAEGNRLYIGWRQVLSGDFRHIAVASSTDAGNSFSAPVIVSDDQWQISACPVSGAALAEDSNKNLQVSWFTAGKAGRQGIYLTESKDAGKTFSPRILISENALGGTPALIAGKNKTLEVAWTEADKIIMVAVPDENKTTENKRQIAEGKLPVTAISGDQVFVGFVAMTNGATNVNLFIANP